MRLYGFLGGKHISMWQTRGSRGMLPQGSFDFEPFIRYNLVESWTVFTQTKFIVLLKPLYNWFTYKKKILSISKGGGGQIPPPPPLKETLLKKNYSNSSATVNGIDHKFKIKFILKWEMCIYLKYHVCMIREKLQKCGILLTCIYKSKICTHPSSS